MKKFMMMINEDNNGMTGQIESNDINEMEAMLSQMWSRGQNYIRLYEWKTNNYGDYAMETIDSRMDSGSYSKLLTKLKVELSYRHKANFSKCDRLHLLWLVKQCQKYRELGVI